MGFIYKITNNITHKCYIGETKKSNPELRWNEHRRKIEKNIGCPALQDAVKKYGIEHFKFEILIICFDEDRYIFEKEYIKKYNSISPNGYNLTTGGEGGGFYGKKHSETTINKIRSVIKERYENNPELRKELSERTKLLFNDQNYRIKISEGLKNSEIWRKSKKEIIVVENILKKQKIY
jgi:group I intron endonuclease